MPSNRVNKSPLSAREGKVYLDGDLVADSCAFTLTFTPKVWEGKALGDPGTNRRWIGYDVTGQIDCWKTSNVWKKKIKEYLDSGATPEFTIQGIVDDVNSDYYDVNGTDTITASGCVMTGDIDLMSLDTDGDVIKESIKFGAKNIA